MKVVILAGGRGTRLSEETTRRPKPMVEIGGRPILWHIMNIYAHHGFREFVVACGYKGEMIKEYFHNFAVKHSDCFLDLRDGSRTTVNHCGLDWKVGLIDTGLETATGGRLLRLKPWIGDSTFMVAYGDGVADVNIAELVAFHRAHKRLATVTAVLPPARFGGLRIDDAVVREFSEKPQAAEGWINGGFFVLEPAVLDYIGDDATSFERGPLGNLAADGQLMAYQHRGFWQPMDTLREKEVLEALWADGAAPWRVWA